MQISLNIKDEIYHKLVNAGVDMQSKINEYLTTLVKKEDDYINSKQFQEDRAYFQEILKGVKSGEAELISQEAYDKEIDSFIKSL